MCVVRNVHVRTCIQYDMSDNMCTSTYIYIYKSWHTLHSHIAQFIGNHVKTNLWAIKHVCGSQKKIALKKKRTFWGSSKTQLWLYKWLVMIVFHRFGYTLYILCPFMSPLIQLTYIEGCLMMSASLSTSKRQSFSSEWHNVRFSVAGIWWWRGRWWPDCLCLRRHTRA